MTQPSVEEIISLLREFPVSEIKIEQDGYKISAVSGPNTYQKPVVEAPVEVETAPVYVEVVEEKIILVTATMVGHFHYPNPALKVGSVITEGQVVGNIESIKVMNDVAAKVGGEVVEILVDDGAPVEFSQPLYRLR